MNRVELTQICRKIRTGVGRESDKIEQMRDIAKEMVKQDQTPYVVFHWSESPRIKMDVKPFKIANTTLSNLNFSAKQGDTLGYFKTKLDIYFPNGADDVDCYQCLRYDIGCDEDDLIGNIQSYRQYSARLSDDEKLFIDEVINVLAKAV